jgi:hypothetical protein
MIQEGRFFLLTPDIDPFAYGEKGIFDGNQYIDLSSEHWADQLPHDAVLPLKRSSPLPDLLVGMPYRCFSDRAYHLFIRKLKIWPRIQWVRVRAVNRNNREVGQYWWPFHRESDYLDVLDLTNSGVEFYPAEYGLKPNTVRKVIHWVLDAKVIGELDFFRGNELEWFVSPKMREMVMDEKLTGFEFVPVGVSV